MRSLVKGMVCLGVVLFLAPAWGMPTGPGPEEMAAYNKRGRILDYPEREIPKLIRQQDWFGLSDAAQMSRDGDSIHKVLRKYFIAETIEQLRGMHSENLWRGTYGEFSGEFLQYSSNELTAAKVKGSFILKDPFSATPVLVGVSFKGYNKWSRYLKPEFEIGLDDITIFKVDVFHNLIIEYSKTYRNSFGIKQQNRGTFIIDRTTYHDGKNGVSFYASNPAARTHDQNEFIPGYLLAGFVSENPETITDRHFKSPSREYSTLVRSVNRTNSFLKDTSCDLLFE